VVKPLLLKDLKGNGGGGGNRTRVRKHLNRGYYMLVISFLGMLKNSSQTFSDYAWIWRDCSRTAI